MIDLTHLTKRFGATVALDDVTFSVAPGTIVGFLGPNGAGKSTCLRSLVGLVRPDSGEATVTGMAYATLADPALFTADRAKFDRTSTALDAARARTV